MTRTLSQHLAIEYTYDKALELGSIAYKEGLRLIDNPFSFGLTSNAGSGLDKRGSLLQAWDTGYKIEQKAK